MEGTLAVVACLQDGAKPCKRSAQCATLPMWKEFDRMVRDSFFHITLEDLAEGRFPLSN